jgi:hypothetical protein
VPNGGHRLNGGNLFRRQAKPITCIAARPRNVKHCHRYFNDQAPLKFGKSRDHKKHQASSRLVFNFGYAQIRTPAISRRRETLLNQG